MSEYETDSIYRRFCENYYEKTIQGMSGREFRRYASENWDVQRVLDYALRRLDVEETKLQLLDRDKKVVYAVSLLRANSLDNSVQAATEPEFRQHVLEEWPTELALDYALESFSDLDVDSLDEMSEDSKVLYLGSLLHSRPDLLPSDVKSCEAALKYSR